METVVWGVVQEGKIIPESPLPEGRRVQIVLADPSEEMPPELREELAAWQRGGAKAWALVDLLMTERSV